MLRASGEGLRRRDVPRSTQTAGKRQLVSALGHRTGTGWSLPVTQEVTHTHARGRWAQPGSRDTSQTCGQWVWTAWAGVGQCRLMEGCGQRGWAWTDVRCRLCGPLRRDCGRAGHGLHPVIQVLMSQWLRRRQSQGVRKHSGSRDGWQAGPDAAARWAGLRGWPRPWPRPWPADLFLSRLIKNNQQKLRRCGALRDPTPAPK